ncbi:c-type cytochrome [Planctomicrobium sp. SH668]|uniref:c-type cytochrome n=1 Tax=Planctomicrobium sp. SH668 TaxID=3448126 RepID=UPI003F5C78AA
MRGVFGLSLLALWVVPQLSFGAETDADAQKARGEYLVHHVAMCVQCHTPRDHDGELQLDEHLLAGAALPVQSPFKNKIWGFQAPSLRSVGLRWGNDKFVAFLQTGKNPNGTVPRAPMPPFRMTEEDANAIAAYLNTLK